MRYSSYLAGETMTAIMFPSLNIFPVWESGRADTAQRMVQASLISLVLYHGDGGERAANDSRCPTLAGGRDHWWDVVVHCWISDGGGGERPNIFL